MTGKSSACISMQIAYQGQNQYIKAISPLYQFNNTCAFRPITSLFLKIFKFFRNTCKTEKETPPVGVKPNTSHLPDECPRPLDHRGFLICPRSLIQVIHVWSLNCDYRLFTRHHMCIPSVQCFTTAHLFHTSVWNNLSVSLFLFFNFITFITYLLKI